MKRMGLHVVLWLACKANQYAWPCLIPACFLLVLMLLLLLLVTRLLLGVSCCQGMLGITLVNVIPAIKPSKTALPPAGLDTTRSVFWVRPSCHFQQHMQVVLHNAEHQHTPVPAG